VKLDVAAYFKFLFDLFFFKDDDAN